MKRRHYDWPLAQPDRPEQRLAAGSSYAADAFAAFVFDNPQVTQVATKGTRKGRPEVRRVPRQSLYRDLPLVTVHPKPWRRVDPAELTGGPALFVKAALAAGREVQARVAGTQAVAVQVGVRHRERNTLELRAMWAANRYAGTIMGGRKLLLAEAKAAL